jgi:hypothetical protein
LSLWRLMSAEPTQVDAMSPTLDCDLCGYIRAARALPELARSVASPAQPPGWLGEPPHNKLLSRSANEYYFGHLPDTSCQILNAGPPGRQSSQVYGGPSASPIGRRSVV